MGRYLEFIKTYRLLHRNRQKRIIFPDACYFITSNTFNWHPFFKEPIFCDLFVENLRLCKRFKGFLLYGWILVYDHFHLMVQPGDDWNISDMMFSIKKQFSHDVNRIIGFNELQPHVKVDKRLSTFEDCGKSSIAKHQKFIYSLKQRFIQKYKNQNSYPKFQWHESFHDHYIRNENDFDYHMNYIEYNIEKHHLPLNWPYVSFNPKYDDLTDEY